MLSEDTKSLIKNNKLLSMFDIVRFITSVEVHRINTAVLDRYDDYHLILTHGVMPEVLMFFEKNMYGLDPKKITILCNNTEIANFCLNNGVHAYVVSEYIFTNEELYSIRDHQQINADCIFPGRPAKSEGLFQKSYDPLRLLIMNQLPDFPIPKELMPEYLNSARCGLMTTETEGSCLSVGEMLSCGLPVVSVGIRTGLDKSFYYPNSRHGCYEIQFPNTLGGRELWLDESNSVICERSDDSIINAIYEVLNTSFDRREIRADFLSRLKHQRQEFLYILKNICDKLNFDIKDLIENEWNSFINLPYSNSRINTSQWKSIIRSFLNTYV